MLNLPMSRNRWTIYVLATAIIGLLFASAAPADAAWKPKNQQQPPQYTQNPPFADAPACPSHNPNEWHGLWDPVRSCHYDHEHKDNPGILYAGMPNDERASAQRLLDVFGPPGAWFGGTSISYPWQTFHGAGPDGAMPPQGALMENSGKHMGYSWIARTNVQGKGGRQITDFRMQVHAIFAAPGATTRYHSYSLEARVCDHREGCQIVRTGGWLDFGRLRISGNPVQLPYQEGDGNRQRLHRHFKDTTWATDPDFKTPAVWYGQFIHPDYVQNNYVQSDLDRPFRKLTIAIETEDAWSNPMHNDLYTNHFYCPEFDCNKNGSTLKLHKMQIEFTQDEAFSAFINRYGRTNPNCTTPSLDCIPTTIEKGGKLNGFYRDTQLPKEYDSSPDGVWWIKYTAGSHQHSTGGSDKPQEGYSSWTSGEETEYFCKID